MPQSDGEIPWPLLRQIVREWAGTSADLAAVRLLDGGTINTTLHIELIDGQQVVMKISPHRVNRDFEREAHQLDLLRSLGLPTPRVHKVQVGSLESPYSFLLMEFMEGVDLSHARKIASAEAWDHLMQHLAEVILQMHCQTAPAYQRILKNESQSFTDWPAFYRHVYDPIVTEIQRSKELPPKMKKKIAKIHGRLDSLLTHADCPRLVHWDVWATNILASVDASGAWRVSAVLDPNCKYAHAEAELAYIDLFNTATPAFIRAYQRQFKLDDGYHKVRKAVYQLYPLMNHVNLFGRDYVKPLIAAVEKAMRVM